MQAIIIKGICTDSAFSTDVNMSEAPVKINTPMIHGANIVAIEFRAWVRFNLLEAVSWGPKAVTYGFAAV